MGSAALIAKSKKFKKIKCLKLVCISDTHNSHDWVEIPDGDILIHAGDFTRFGNIQHAISFNTWLGKLPHKLKIVVNGNHEKNQDWISKIGSILTNCIFLKGSGICIEGIKIFGINFGWAGETECKLIPLDTDIVVSHGPVYGYVDGGGGCPKLLERIKQIKPTLVISGHIHGAHGIQKGNGILSNTTFINASISKDGYKPGWRPILFHYNFPF
jgi:predicted phosphohydrolase